jgi:hypothetical protein
MMIHHSSLPALAAHRAGLRLADIVVLQPRYTLAKW